MNPDLTPEERAADLVSRMTLAEKASQMQHTAPAIPRLGVPAYNWWNEALHGVARAGLATVFPQAIGLAATWDAGLMRRVADAISTEARAKYHEALRAGNAGQYSGLTFWSPNINIFRDPRWGRGQETYGEDPYLTGRMAVAFVQGMQGDDPRYLKTVATPKHYAVHSGPDPARHSFDAVVSESDLAGTYLPAFRAGVSEGGAFSVMCSYNRVDGAPACASNDLLQSRLRDAWGFRGYVVSDCGAITDIWRGHHYAKDATEAVAMAVKAGTDLSCGNEYRLVEDAVRSGALAESVADRALVRLFAARIRLGMFDPPEGVPYASIPYSENASDEHRALALEAAASSIVLLKNDGPLLPLGADARRIAVLGPAADWPDMQLGNYSGTARRLVTPLEGIRRRFADREVSFALGSTYTPESPALVPVEALRTGDQTGLLGEYFASGDLSGAPALVRVDERLYFNWDSQEAAVGAAIPRDRFSARWTGTMRAPYDGEYVIGLARPECGQCSGTTSMRLYLDGQLAVDEKTPVQFPHQTRGRRVSWTAGSTHDVRVEFRQDRGSKAIELVWIPPADALLEEARQTAAQSDVAIVCAGLTADLESEESGLKIEGFSGGDRTDIRLPAGQQRLLRAALDSGKPVVVVLATGSAIVAAGAQEEAAAVLEAWYPGQEGGNAIAAVLAGDVNPSGRLPVTFYRSVEQLPPFEDYSMAGRTYRFFTGSPLYGFGYGLSYSTFKYTDLAVEPQAGGAMRVTARVTNVSARDGDEVAQLYAGPEGALPQLAGFVRVRVPAGESRTVEFQASPGSGRVTLSVGGGQPVEGTAYVQATVTAP